MAHNWFPVCLIKKENRDSLILMCLSEGVLKKFYKAKTVPFVPHDKRT